MRSRGVLWKLIRLPYGIVEKERQWLYFVKLWITKSNRMEHVTYVNHLFIKRSQESSIFLIVAKVVDNFLISGDTPAI